LNTGKRIAPDVSLDGSNKSGVTGYQGGLTQGGFGSSLSCPCWAGIIAIVNQGRAASGNTSLNSIANPQQALQALYSLPASDFHDVTSGYIGLSAGIGFDEATGRGTPIATTLVPHLVGYGLTPAKLVYGVQPSSTPAGQNISPSVTVRVVD